MAGKREVLMSDMPQGGADAVMASARGFRTFPTVIARLNETGHLSQTPGHALPLGTSAEHDRNHEATH